MSFDPFPERIDPRKLFTRNGAIGGVIPLARLQRLSEYLSSDIGQVEASLSFEHDANRRRLVTGPIKATVSMLCQRCLKETSVSLETEINVLVLSDKQWSRELSDSLPKGLEAVQVSEDDLDVQALIEDEVILSLPIVVYHEEQDCNKELNQLKDSAEDADQVSGNTAFAGLQALKEQLKD